MSSISISMQVYNQAQDENPSLGAPGKMPGLLGKHLQPKTARKALGNITNTSRAAEPGQDKTPAAGLKTSRKSKALGDITNVGRTGTKAQPATKQLGSRKLAARSLQEVQPTAEPESPLFDEPVEALAGKGWRQLAAEAEEREDREMAARVKDFWRPARVHHWPYSVQVSSAGLSTTMSLLHRSARAVSQRHHSTAHRCPTHVGSS